MKCSRHRLQSETPRTAWPQRHRKPTTLASKLKPGHRVGVKIAAAGPDKLPAFAEATRQIIRLYNRLISQSLSRAPLNGPLAQFDRRLGAALR